MILEISSPLECRATGRTLEGPAIRYGDVSSSHKERFEPGAFTLDEKTRWLNYKHDQHHVLAFTGGGGLELRDTPEALMVSAVLPNLPLCDHALAEVRARKLLGFSLEFRSIDETVEDGIRVLRLAEVAGVGLVSSPSYPESKAELRARSGRTLRATIPENKKLACECSGAACRMAEFLEGAVSEMLENALDGAANTIATMTNYSRPIASVKRGTLRRGPGNSVDIDLPAGPAGDAVISAHEDVGVVLRPFLDPTESVSVIEGTTAIYTRARARAFVLSSTDASAGWPEPIIVATPEQLLVRSTRRVRRWL